MADPRDLELLAALAVELHQLGDGRHLAQQADIVEAPLLDRQRRPLRLRHPAHLPLDLTHEGFDLLGCGLSLLVLDLNRGAAVLLVHEIEIEGGIDHQHAGHQADEEHDVFDEQAPLHSVISLARTKSHQGIVTSTA